MQPNSSCQSPALNNTKIIFYCEPIQCRLCKLFYQVRVGILGILKPTKLAKFEATDIRNLRICRNKTNIMSVMQLCQIFFYSFICAPLQNRKKEGANQIYTFCNQFLSFAVRDVHDSFLNVRGRFAIENIFSHC